MSAWEAAPIDQPMLPLAEQHARVEHELKQIITAALVRVPYRDPAGRVRCKVVRGKPGPVLVAEADRATLLVVGSHNQQRIGGLAHRLVSAYRTRHAPRPVVVIPPAIGLRGIPTNALAVTGPNALEDSMRSATLPHRETMSTTRSPVHSRARSGTPTLALGSWRLLE